MKPDLFLLGSMGSGKTTIGRELAERSGRSFVDLDAYIETRAGMPISALFAGGEEVFRRRERECFAELVEGEHPGTPGPPRVVALGGGAFAQAEIRSAIRRHGLSIYLVVPIPTLTARLEDPELRAHRPLLQVENWRGRLDSLLLEREALFAHARYAVDADGDPATVVARISKLLGEEIE